MKKFKYKYIIWDWNGTLCNDLTPTCNAFNFCRSKANLTTISEKEFQEMYSHPIIDMYKNCGLLSAKYTYKEISADFFKEYNNYPLKLHKDVIKVLDYLTKIGILMSVASANFQDFLEKEVNNLKLKKYFEFVVGTSFEDVGGRKEVQIKKILSNIKIPANEVIVIGDTLNDLDMAKSMNIDCILLASGMTSYERLSKNNDVVYHDLGEFYNYYFS